MFISSSLTRHHVNCPICSFSRSSPRELGACLLGGSHSASTLFIISKSFFQKTDKKAEPHHHARATQVLLSNYIELHEAAMPMPMPMPMSMPGTVDPKDEKGCWGATNTYILDIKPALGESLMPYMPTFPSLFPGYRSLWLIVAKLEGFHPVID